MCGVIGILGTPLASQEVYQGLLVLQHRGQDSAGILSYDVDQHTFNVVKGVGLVDRVFNKEKLDQLPGRCSVGHTRYSTVGSSNLSNIQPSIINFPYGIGLAHNGNLVNFYELAESLKKQGQRHIFTENDSEVLVNLVADGLSRKIQSDPEGPMIVAQDSETLFEHLCSSVEEVFKKTKGAYSVVGNLGQYGLFAFRDPMGIRPLVLGTRELSEEEKQSDQDLKQSVCMASESNALNFLGYKNIRDLQSGEIVFVDNSGKIFSKTISSEKKHHCFFEWVYFAGPESTIEKKDVYHSRIESGRKLGEKINGMIKEGMMAPDLVVPVPETSRACSIGLSEITGIPYREILIKNRYVQRSFILNTQASRERAVQLKLAPVKGEFEGKKILLVDDSIVRGTTSQRIIEMVRNAGAKEVYFASACPPVLFPCFYGIDFPTSDELIAYNRSFEEIEKKLKADRVIYIEKEDLIESIGVKDLCMACIDGNYPLGSEINKRFQQARVAHKKKK